MIAEPFDELFARYPARYQPLWPLVSLGGGGGLSGAKLWRYRATHGDLLLRAWPTGDTTRQHVEQVHRWLSLTAELDFVPVPIPDRSGGSVQEWHATLWELTPWLAGAAELSCPPALWRLRLAFTGLAAFHERLAGQQVQAVSPGLTKRRDEIIRLVGGGFDRLETAITGQPNSRCALRPIALAWLVLARQVAPLVLERLEHVSRVVTRTQPVLRDARPAHFLFEADRLSGLVDFGAMGVESVAADLARLIGEWLDGDPEARQEAVASYERVRPLDADEARLIAVFEATTALFIGERWSRWHFVENRRFDDPEAVSNGLARGLMRVQRLARELAGSQISSRHAPGVF